MIRPGQRCLLDRECDGIFEEVVKSRVGASCFAGGGADGAIALKIAVFGIDVGDEDDAGVSGIGDKLVAVCGGFVGRDGQDDAVRVVGVDEIFIDFIQQ